MFLAHHLWSRTDPGEAATEDAWWSALLAVDVAAGSEHEQLWARLTTNQQRALRGIRLSGSPYKAEAERLLELTRGSVQDAVRALERATVLERDGDRWRFVDPLLARWVDRRFSPGAV